VRAVVHASGVDVPLNEHSRDLAAHLRGVDHLVFFLADGLGIDSVDRMPRNSWIRRHTLRAIHAPFPSTTTSAITSFATAEHPAQHAVAGWWVHVPALMAPATVFLHDRAIDAVSLTDLGVGVEVLSPSPTVLPRMTRSAALVQPEGIADSPYTTHIAGGCERIPYRTPEGAVDAILRRVQEATGPTFTYWYTPSPDTEEHDDGAEGDRTFRALARVDAAAEALAAGLDETGHTWRIVGTADHGHLDLEPRLEVEEHDALLAHLECAPSGDMRVQFWHVRPEAEAAFCTAFRARFGREFYLLPAAHAEALRLFGPQPWGDEMRRRAGTHVTLSRGRAALRLAAIPGIAGYRRMRSGHSGLSPAEMRVPLVIAGEDGGTQDYGL
ncbi:MAG: alkaline phosphatase family protein, partial [Dehalococcoidia bacterium]